jgi:pimeloyl-ACP methyl ester carboxylesterase
MLVATMAQPVAAQSDCVVLLHGLARTEASMRPLQSALQREGFSVVNRGYPSRHQSIEELAPLAVETGLAQCPRQSPQVHFVTHSLGGILVRYYLSEHGVEKLGKVVMLAPPNQGSQVVDNLRDVPGFAALNGPAGLQLGTDESSVPLSLGAVDFTLGVIAGTSTINPILSLNLPNPDDGKVSVENTKVEGMTDFLAVPHSHPFIMGADDVIEQVVLFLREGRFKHAVDRLDESSETQGSSNGG